MKRRSTVVLAVAIGLGISLSACASGPGGTKAAAHPTNCAVKITNTKAPEVTLWGWSPTDEVAVKQFNAAHEDVQICWTNAGAGQAEYDKFSTAITAKTGAPDVIMLETEVLTSFEIKNALVNLSKYGANAVRSNFAAGTLKDISQGNDIYAIPDDGGPVAMMYRKDIFDKYGLTVPTTWDEYAADAQKLKDAGGPLIGDWPSDTPQFPQALFNQKGAKTFDYSLDKKESIGIDIDNQPSKDVLNYWNDLVKKKLVDTVGEQTTDFASNVVKGNYATFIAASWEPGHLVGAGIKPGPDSPWRVAPLPQWNSSDPQVNWGGSTYAVTTQSTQPKLAAEVAIGLFGDENQTTIGAHFPLHLKAQKADWFQAAADPFFGGQTANKDVWIPAAQGYEGTSYSPFQSYYYAQLVTQLSKLNDGDTTPDAALSGLQKTVAAYAKSQGLTVK
jgi:multiple sugar transport system substrate-binding protein